MLCYGLQEGGGTVKYKAEITFMSRADLFTEIDALIKDLRKSDGFVDAEKCPEWAWRTMLHCRRVRKCAPPNEDDPTFKTYTKLKTIFGKIDDSEIGIHQAGFGAQRTRGIRKKVLGPSSAAAATPMRSQALAEASPPPTSAVEACDKYARWFNWIRSNAALTYSQSLSDGELALLVHCMHPVLLRSPIQ